MFLVGQCLLIAETGGFVAKLRFENPFSNNKHGRWFRSSYPSMQRCGKPDLTSLLRPVMVLRMKTILSTLIVALAMTAHAATPLAEIPLKDINGKDTSLKAYQGKVILIVNVASKCGYTPQYKSLEATFQKYQAQGLVVLGFPCNQFGGQEPGTNEEIKSFCSANYGITFPLFDKLDVKGPKQHPLYVALSGKDSQFPGDVKWNFGKFLVGRDGKLIQRWDSKATPNGDEITKAIEAALAAK